MAQTIHIAGRAVGAGHPTLVIAEIGVNHDGSVQRAKALAAAAARAGADAVKLQVFRGQTLMHASARFAQYQQAQVTAADPAEMLRQYELDDDQLAEVTRAIAAAGLVPLATPFSPTDVDRIAALGMPAMKIASPDLVNRLLLDRALRHRVPLLLSTGAASGEEVTSAAGWLYGRGASFALLHCVSSYPAPPEAAHLGWIGWLAGLSVAPVGYSDHTSHPLAGALAVAAGASIVEAHLTYDQRASGPDHAASFDERQFAEYVAAIRQADRLVGPTGPRAVLDVEADVRDVSRQSLVLTRDVPAGAALSPADLTCQRPGTGISARWFESAVGRRTRVALRAGAMLAAAQLDGGPLGEEAKP